VRLKISPYSDLGKDRKAVSPAISTVILTGAIVVLLLVTVVFANNFLNARMAENEFSAMKQFMQTVGLQIDDVAWTIGRTQTISYSSKFGLVNFESAALNYTVYVNGTVYFASYVVGIVLFNMPVGKYSLGNSYYESIYPSNRSFLQTGTSAPVSRVYVREKLPMNDGSFIRVVVAPIIRMLNSTISTGGGIVNYFKFYLPILKSAGFHPRQSQSVTLKGGNVSVKTQDGVSSVRIYVSFPKEIVGFGSDFFNFESQMVEVNVPPGSVIEFYTGEVIVTLGLHG
jgi:hypothetical protein